MEYILEMKNITKEFPGVKALDKVDFEVKDGEILGLVGENGAGKSTLIKIIGGIHIPSKGEIYVGGKKVVFNSPNDAFSKGISIVHQELNLCPNLTVAENVFLGMENLGEGRNNFLKTVDMKKLEEAAQNLLNRIGAQFSPNTLVRELSTAQQQMVEICKALARNPKMILMDEPTSSLSIEEVERLMKIIKELKKQGISIVFVSHRIEEVVGICDRVIILRDGKRVGTLEKDEIEENKIIKYMVGRDVELFPKHVERKKGELILEVKNLKWQKMVKDVSFKLHRGEILGFAGLVGAGRSETMQLIFGINKLENGEMFYKGHPYNPESPYDAIKNGIALIPEDRKLQGLILQMSVKDNIVIPSLRRIAKSGFVLDEIKEREIAKEFVNKLQVRTPSIYHIANNLSGGNQQKVVLAKWLVSKSDVLIFDEPTRGIDVASKAEIHKLMEELAAQGYGVIMISSELPEILNLSDRIIVMFEGKVMVELDNSKRNITQEEIMYYASGKKQLVNP
ncbi:MAG TPA: sugar ABC transporter ATP-binding protein [Thermotogaceae bacterium]|nr:sugar ABC transporter ATP-binding protein [Thermotogaceae bacterium]